MKCSLPATLFLVFWFYLLASAQTIPHQRLRVSDNHRFLVYEDGTPFFYLGDTGWELFHRLRFEEAAKYFDNRVKKGFTVIQAVVLAEFDGLHTPNAYGHTPLKNDDPAQPNEAYFKDVDRFIQLAADRGLYIGLLPTWGDKIDKAAWGMGPEVFNVSNARAYGEWIGRRYKDQWNIIWILGGDRNPRNENDVNIWRAMAAGIAKGVGGYDKALMSFHPQPHEPGGSSTWFHHDEWLDFNMHQTGHCRDGARYDKIAYDYDLTPLKPTMDGEPLYEDHPVCFNAAKFGHSNADDVRKLAYWDLFAGAHGHTYGCHDIWQFHTPQHPAVNAPVRYWQEALDLPGAQQMKYVKQLMLSRPFLTRIPDQSLLAFDNPKDSAYCSATRSRDGSYAFIYTPTGHKLALYTAALSGKQLKVYWYNPRTGRSRLLGIFEKQKLMHFDPPSHGFGQDWVLVLEDARRQFPPPGIKS